VKIFLAPPWGIIRLPNLWNREFTSDLAQIYDDEVVALDPKRNLNNGLPSALTALIEALELKEGQTVLHTGTGMGYFTALIAHCVGETGRGRARTRSSVGDESARESEATSSSRDPLRRCDDLRCRQGRRNPR
jgi:Protein-L-isoaspartate(D-aspartate) O-methyltransferase (PCMT)